MDRFARLATEPEDPPELKLRKLLGMGMSVLLVPVYLFYGLFYFSVGARLAGQLAVTGAIVLLLLCLGSFTFRNYYVFARLMMGFQQVALLSIHLSLGGFTSSAYVLVYALISLLLAPILDEPRNARYWLCGTIFLVLVAGVAEFVIPHGNTVSPVVLTTLTLFNILGFCGLVLLPSQLFARRILAINEELSEARAAQLAQKAEHLAQTQQALERRGGDT